MLEFAEWLDVVDSLGVLGVLIGLTYVLRKEIKELKEELRKERLERILDLKRHSENSESLLEKTLIALQDNQRFLENSLTSWKQEIKDKIGDLENLLK